MDLLSDELQLVLVEMHDALVVLEVREVALAFGAPPLHEVTQHEYFGHGVEIHHPPESL